jgi:hypothetical protein
MDRTSDINSSKVHTHRRSTYNTGCAVFLHCTEKPGTLLRTIQNTEIE